MYEIRTESGFRRDPNSFGSYKKRHRKLSSFSNEAEISKLLINIYLRNVVEIHSVDEPELTISMKILDITRPKNEKLCQDVFNGLNNLHSLDIVHLDVHPRNVGWDLDRNQWCLFDFDAGGILDKATSRVISGYRTLSDNLNKNEWVVTPRNLPPLARVKSLIKLKKKDRVLKKLTKLAETDYRLYDHILFYLNFFNSSKEYIEFFHTQKLTFKKFLKRIGRRNRLNMAPTLNYTHFVGAITTLHHLLTIGLFENATIKLCKKKLTRTKKGIVNKTTATEIQAWQIFDNEDLCNGAGCVWLEVEKDGEQFELIIPPHDFSDEAIGEDDKLKNECCLAEEGADKAIKLFRKNREDSTFVPPEACAAYYFALVKGQESLVKSAEPISDEEDEEFEDKAEFEYFTGSCIWVFGKIVHVSDETSVISIPLDKGIVTKANTIKRIGFKSVSMIAVQSQCACCT